MSKEKLKKEIIRMISEIEDESYLKALSVIIDSGNNNLNIELNKDQIAEIASSRKDIENGKYIENSLLEKEVKVWLKRR